MSQPQAFVASATEGESFNAGPYYIVSRVQGGQSNGLFELYELTLGPGGSVDYHVHHTMDETITVIEGQVEFNVTGKKTSHGPGAVAFVPRGLHHGFKNVGPGKVRVFILFTPSGSQHEFFRLLEKLFAAPTLDTAALLSAQKKYDQELIPPG
jgi:quercetin dioxygenase-like cupin family protein